MLITFVKNGLISVVNGHQDNREIQNKKERVFVTNVHQPAVALPTSVFEINVELALCLSNKL
jgi:hypothetical protein